MRRYATFYLSFSTICSVDSLFSSADAFLWENLVDRECVLGDSGGFGILWCSSERMCSLSPLEEEKEVNNINLNEVEPIENGLFGFWGEGVFLEIQSVYGAVKWGNKNVQIVLQHCRKTSWIATSRVLLATFKTVLQQLKLGRLRKFVAESACRE